MNYLEILLRVIDNGADVNAHDEGYRYPMGLSEASILSYLNVVQMLLDNIADPNICGGASISGQPFK